MKKTLAILLATLIALCCIPSIAAFALEEQEGEPEGRKDLIVSQEGDGEGDVPGTPDTPDTPDTLDTPDTPDTPEEPAQPEHTVIYDDVNNMEGWEEGGIKRFAADVAIAGYKYSFRDNYFYVDQASAWQGNYGFMKAYDLVAPYVLMEYDYVRVYFTYEGKDWMLQLWKGQYGLAFYGAEFGTYNKSASDEEDSIMTTYKAAQGDDRPYVQTSVYHDPSLTGNYSRIFTTPYEQTWWSTGFKNGHLTRQEPASELRQNGVVTFRNEELAELFASGLKKCGFGDAQSITDVAPDTCIRDGVTVYYSWQDISEAETTMPIKITGATLIFFYLGAFLTLAVVVLGAFMGMGLLLILI